MNAPADPAFRSTRARELRPPEGDGADRRLADRVEPGYVEIALPYRDDLTQQKGYVHGGILGMIADTACGYAAFSLMPADGSLVTVEYKINILKPGARLAGRQGQVVKPGPHAYRRARRGVR